MKFSRTLRVTCLLGMILTHAAFAGERPVVIVPVEGEIEEGLTYVVRRGIEKAEAENAHAVILRMDTYGGKVTAAEKIMQALSRTAVPTYTFVDTKAISAGALIAAATRGIYMAPQSQIGDAKLIQMSPMGLGGAKEIDEGLKEKAESPVRAMVRSACERNGHPWPIFEAMMDESVAISNVVEEGKLLTLTSAEAVSNDVAVEIVGSLSLMREHLGLEDAPVIRVEEGAQETVARFLTGTTVSGLLLMLGLAGLFIEIRTPGVGVPGVIGVVCLALFFWGHHIAGISGWFTIFLFSVGVLLLLLEIFVIPGFGIAGISGIICILASLVLTMVQWEGREMTGVMHAILGPLATVTVAFVGALVLLWVTAKFLPAAPIVSRVFLPKTMAHDEGYTSRDEAELKKWDGARGVARTTLRPAGKAVIKGVPVDVVTGGEWLQSGTAIKVVNTSYNRIVVAEDTDAGAADA